MEIQTGLAARLFFIAQLYFSDCGVFWPRGLKRAFQLKGEPGHLFPAAIDVADDLAGRAVKVHMAQFQYGKHGMVAMVGAATAPGACLGAQLGYASNMWRNLLMVLLMATLLLGRLPAALAAGGEQPVAGGVEHHHHEQSHDCCEDKGAALQTIDHCASGCDHGAGHCGCHQMVMAIAVVPRQTDFSATTVARERSSTPPTQRLTPPERPPRLS